MKKFRETLDSILWFSLRPIQYIAFAFTLAGSMAALVRIVLEHRVHSPGYINEIVLLIGLCALISFAALFIKTLYIYRTIQALRFFFYMILIRLTGLEDAGFLMMLLCPFILEIALYDTLVASFLMNGTFLAILNLQFYRLRSGFSVSLSFFFLLNGLYLFAWWIGTLVSVMRDYAVTADRHIVLLNNTVEKLTKANIGFQDVADSLEAETAERERNRVTRELHDSIGYTLTNVSIMMKTGKILMDKDPERLRTMFDEVNSMVNESLEETRRILRVFRSIHEPSRVGLKAIAALVKNFEMINTLKVELNLGNLPWTLGDHLDTILLHFVQEGITNAFRHGQADHIRISLWRSLEGIIATVWDNGSGISTELQEGIGIKGMRERLAGVGGTLAAQNVVDGFLLKAFIPLRMEALSGSD